MKAFVLIAVSCWLFVSCFGTKRSVFWADNSKALTEYADDHKVTYSDNEISFSFYIYDLPDDVLATFVAPLISCPMDEKALADYNIISASQEKAVLEEYDYRKWINDVKDCAASYTDDSSCILFTVPGIMVACIEDNSEFAGKANCDLVYSKPSFYRKTDVSDYADVQDSLILRCIHKDVRKDVVIVADRIKMKNGKVLCLLYSVCGNTANYVVGKDGVARYVYDGTGNKKLHVNKDWFLICEKIRESCDEMSVSIMESLVVPDSGSLRN